MHSCGRAQTFFCPLFGFYSLTLCLSVRTVQCRHWLFVRLSLWIRKIHDWRKNSQMISTLISDIPFTGDCKHILWFLPLSLNRTEAYHLRGNRIKYRLFFIHLGRTRWVFSIRIWNYERENLWSFFINWLIKLKHWTELHRIHWLQIHLNLFRTMFNFTNRLYWFVDSLHFKKQYNFSRRTAIEWR